MTPWSGWRRIFLMRYPLVDGQGNWGSLDGDSAAAMRYTEARMTSIAEQMLSDIQKETVDFKPNYDNRLMEPSVLPAAVPQLLINGSFGIAVGMATSIPPHNLGEVIDATNHLIDHPDANLEDLMQFVKGPDFPHGRDYLRRQRHRTGLRHRARRSGDAGRGGNNGVGKFGFQIIISSIPYQVNKSEMIIKMADLIREKKMEGIRDIRDESDRGGKVRIAIDLKTGANPQNVLNNLYKYTDLEKTFHFNVIALWWTAFSPKF